MLKGQRVIRKLINKIATHYDGLESNLVFHILNHEDLLLIERGASRTLIVLTEDLRDLDRKELLKTVNRLFIDLVLFIYTKTIRHDNPIILPSKTIYKSINEFKENKRNKKDKLKQDHFTNTLHRVSLKMKLEDYEVLTPHSSDAWIIAEKNNKRSLIFSVYDMDSIDKKNIRKLLLKTESDEIIFIVERLLRKERILDLSVPIKLLHAKDFKPNKIGNKNG